MSERYSISALANLLRLVVGRGKIQTGTDTGPVQVFQIVLSAKETPNVRRLAEFGFTSFPMAKCDSVAVFINGDRSNGVIIATGDQAHRFPLANPGEVAVFDAFGKSIYLTKDGGIVVNANGADVTINDAADVGVTFSGTATLTGPTVHMTGDLQVDGNIKSNGTVADSVRAMSDDRTIYDGHTHPVSGGDTGVPNQPE